MEISGDVAVVKSATGFELFGTIETLRGAYELYGKRFVLQKGKLEFLGGQEINPQVDIEALYSFRDSDRAKRQMALQLSGSLDKPDFSFCWMALQSRKRTLLPICCSAVDLKP